MTSAPKALEVARGNAARKRSERQDRISESDLFLHDKKKKKNSSYKRFFRYDSLESAVYTYAGYRYAADGSRDHEPIKALDGGSDGLDFYRRIAEDAFGSLKKDGLMFLEIGCDQAGSGDLSSQRRRIL